MIDDTIKSMCDAFIEHSWKVIHENDYTIICESPLKDCEFIIKKIKNKIQVKTPIPNSNYQYNTHFTKISDVAPYILIHFGNYMNKMNY
tara:strand:+ start:3422 stop:3688 length:267 start_codon:yes stop_codon:yes gene_type:complete